MNSPGRSPPCKQPEPGHGSSCRVAETPSKHEENGGYSNSNADGKEQPERGGQEGAWRRAAETPSKHEENGGYSDSNINTQREQDDDWGYV